MKICAKCKNVSIKSRMGESRWYDYMCTAVTRDSGIDPVSGKRGFQATNDLGQRYFTDEQFPNCRTINTDGSCLFYEGPSND